MKKRTMMMMMAAAVAISMSGCQGGAKAPETNEKEVSAETTEAAEEAKTEETTTDAEEETTTDAGEETTTDAGEEATTEASKPEFRELPVFELSDDLNSKTFSLGGHIFKLGETAIQDLVQCGYELDCAPDTIINESGSIIMRVPDDGLDSQMWFEVNPHHEDLNVMDPKLVIWSVGYLTDDISKTQLPELIVAGMDMTKEFTSLEDLQAKFGGGEISDIGSGHRSFDFNLLPEGSKYLTYSVTHYSTDPTRLSISFRTNQE